MPFSVISPPRGGPRRRGGERELLAEHPPGAGLRGRTSGTRRTPALAPKPHTRAKIGQSTFRTLADRLQSRAGRASRTPWPRLRCRCWRRPANKIPLIGQNGRRSRAIRRQRYRSSRPQPARPPRRPSRAASRRRSLGPDGRSSVLPPWRRRPSASASTSQAVSPEIRRGGAPRPAGPRRLQAPADRVAAFAGAARPRAQVTYTASWLAETVIGVSGLRGACFTWSLTFPAPNSSPAPPRPASQGPGTSGPRGGQEPPRPRAAIARVPRGVDVGEFRAGPVRPRSSSRAPTPARNRV